MTDAYDATLAAAKLEIRKLIADLAARFSNLDIIAPGSPEFGALAVQLSAGVQSAFETYRQCRTGEECRHVPEISPAAPLGALYEGQPFTLVSWMPTAAHLGTAIEAIAPHTETRFLFDGRFVYATKDGEQDQLEGAVCIGTLDAVGENRGVLLCLTADCPRDVQTFLASALIDQSPGVVKIYRAGAGRA